NDLPGMHFDDATHTENAEVQANEAVPQYYGKYEKVNNLPVIRPVRVEEVTERDERFYIKTNDVQFSALGIINATGTWKNPKCPKYPGWNKFQGRQLHTGEYESAEAFKGKHVVIVGAGISAIQMLDEVSRVTSTTWVTRRPPAFREEKFTKEKGRQAVALVEERVRKGL